MRRSARATLIGAGAEDNRAAGACGSRRPGDPGCDAAVGPVGVGWRGLAMLLWLVASVAACRPSDLPEPGATVRTLTRLEGAPTVGDAPQRLRLLVADASFFVHGDDDPAGALDRLEAFADRAATFVPDVAVVFDAPVAGAAFAETLNSGAPLGIGRERSAVDPAQTIAVTLDRFHRVEAVTFSGRARWAGGTLAGGPLVLAELPLALDEHEAVGRGGAEASRPSRTRIRVGGDTPFAFALEVADRVPGATDALVVSRGPSCDPPGIASADGSVCVRLPSGWTLLRSSADAEYEGARAGTVLRVEVALPVVLAPPEGSQ